MPPNPAGKGDDNNARIRPQIIPPPQSPGGSVSSSVSGLSARSGSAAAGAGGGGSGSGVAGNNDPRTPLRSSGTTAASAAPVRRYVPSFASRTPGPKPTSSNRTGGGGRGGGRQPGHVRHSSEPNPSGGLPLVGGGGPPASSWANFTAGIMSGGGQQQQQQQPAPASPRAPPANQQQQQQQQMPSTPLQETVFNGLTEAAAASIASIASIAAAASGTATATTPGAVSHSNPASPTAAARYSQYQRSPVPSGAMAALTGGSVTNTPMRQQPATAGGGSSAPSSPSSRASTSVHGPPPPTPVQPHPGAPPPLVPSLSSQTAASHASSTADAGVLLGVEALERQQEALEQKRLVQARQMHQAQAEQRQRQQQQQQALAAQRQQQQQAAAQQQQQQQQQQRELAQAGGAGGRYPAPRYPAAVPSSDDDNTEPSSDLASATAANAVQQQGGADGRAARGAGSVVKRSSSFGKFLKTPLKLKQSLSTGESKTGDGTGKPGGGCGNGAKTPGSAAGSTVLLSPPPTSGGAGSGGGGANPADDDDDMDDEGMWADHEVKPLVYGYLHKLGRNGQWQKRFFETDGECLTYYKSRKRTKLLASLDLRKVGEIKCDEDDPDNCVFSIQVSDRPYYLRAETMAACKDWVISLNRVREARMEIGGIQLVQPHFSHEEDEVEGGTGSDRNRSESDEYAARVVMIANRTRTRAIATTETEESLKKLMRQQQQQSTGPVSVDYPAHAPASSGSTGASGAEGLAMSPSGSPRMMSGHLPPVVLARWQKRRTNLQRLKWRLTQWARKINVMACMHMPHVAHVAHQHAPDISYADSGIGGQLSDIDEHGGDQQGGVRQVGSIVSGGSAQSGEYEAGQEIAARELS